MEQKYETSLRGTTRIARETDIPRGPRRLQREMRKERGIVKRARRKENISRAMIMDAHVLSGRVFGIFPSCPLYPFADIA
ncbi:hypothetical protein PUN28_005961 [Cardiocondyla obscurior]|uniref:Uncharacterized protein n=1 Tax=Cardiocondyla obscurior TaxID=286306 RepID=A0AAW2GA45_9HYME